MKHSNEYLYGTDEVPRIPNDVILERLKLLKHNLTVVNSISYTERDYVKQRAIIKAISFWEKFLREEK